MTTLTDGYRFERNWPTPPTDPLEIKHIMQGVPVDAVKPLTESRVATISRRQAWGVVLLVLGLGIAYGCAKNGQGLTTLGAGAEHSVKIESLAEQTKSELKPVRTNNDGKIRLKNSIENQDQIIENSKATRKAMADADKQHIQIVTGWEKKYGDLDGKWYVRAGRVIDRWLRILKWTVIIVFIAGIGLKMAGLNISGFTGASFSYIGSGLLHMIPWVGGLLNEWFANAWFRDRQAKVAATSPKIVEVPTAVTLPQSTNAPATVAGVQTTPEVPVVVTRPAARKRTTTRKKAARR